MIRSQGKVLSGQSVADLDQPSQPRRANDSTVRSQLLIRVLQYVGAGLVATATTIFVVKHSGATAYLLAASARRGPVPVVLAWSKGKPYPGLAKGVSTMHLAAAAALGAGVLLYTFCGGTAAGGDDADATPAEKKSKSGPSAADDPDPPPELSASRRGSDASMATSRTAASASTAVTVTTDQSRRSKRRSKKAGTSSGRDGKGKGQRRKPVMERTSAEAYVAAKRARAVAMKVKSHAEAAKHWHAAVSTKHHHHLDDDHDGDHDDDHHYSSCPSRGTDWQHSSLPIGRTSLICVVRFVWCSSFCSTKRALCFHNCCRYTSAAVRI